MKKDISEIGGRVEKTFFYILNGMFVFADEMLRDQEVAQIYIYDFIEKYLPECIHDIEKMLEESMFFSDFHLLERMQKNLDCKYFLDFIISCLKADTLNEKRTSKEMLKDKLKLFNIRQDKVFDIIDVFRACQDESNAWKEATQAYFQKIKDVWFEEEKQSMFSLSASIGNCMVCLDEFEGQLSVLEECYNQKKYEEGIKLINGSLLSLIIFVNSGLSFLLIKDKLGDDFDYSPHYVPEDSIRSILIQMRNFFNCLLIKEDGFDLELMKYIIRDNCQLIHRKCSCLRMLFGILALEKSIQYNYYERKYIQSFIDVFLMIFYEADVHNIVINAKPYSGASEKADFVNSRMATTRMQVIFTLQNRDVFSLRIDMPHKGMPRIHLNLEEISQKKVISSGIPLEKNKIHKNLLKKLSEKSYSSLFFETTSQIWFRSGFEEKLRTLDLLQENKKHLSKIFKHQAHLKIYVTKLTRSEEMTVVSDICDVLNRVQIEGGSYNTIRKDNQVIYNRIIDIKRRIILEELIHMMIKEDLEQDMFMENILKIFSKDELSQLEKAIDIRTMIIDEYRKLVDSA